MPGDIGAVAKVEEIEFDSVLHDSHDEDHIHLKPLEFPKPMHGLAVETKRKGDEQRMFEILHKLEIEDPCFEVERHPTTNETVIRGLGELHLRGKLEKMASQYKLEVDTTAAQDSLSRNHHRGRPRVIIATRSRPAAPASSARCISRSSRASAAPVSSSSIRPRAA